MASSDPPFPTDDGGRPVGTVPGGLEQPPRAVTAHVLMSDQLEVEVWDLGARLVEVLAPDREGTRTNVILRYATPIECTRPGQAYLGASIGRYANRIAHGAVEIAGRRVDLAVNEGPHQLHGGPIGFDQHVWDTVEATRESVTFRHVSPDGDQGFPGEVTAEVTYTLSGSALTIETVAVSDADTIFGTTNHSYWNLAGAGTIADHELLAPARHYVEIDGELIPTGALRGTEGTLFDFATSTPLAPIVDAGGIDHCLVTDGRVHVTLAHPPSGRVMTLDAAQPGVQVYTGQYLPEPFSGICLEPEQLPDTPHHPEFGSSLLRPGETYRHLAVHTFAVIQ